MATNINKPENLTDTVNQEKEHLDSQDFHNEFIASEHPEFPAQKIKESEGEQQEQDIKQPPQQISEPVRISIQQLKETGLIEAYQYFLRQLCKNGLPTGNIFEYAAVEILSYERKKKQDKLKKQLKRRTGSPLNRSIAESQIGQGNTLSNTKKGQSSPTKALPNQNINKETKESKVQQDKGIKKDPKVEQPLNQASQILKDKQLKRENSEKEQEKTDLKNQAKKEEKKNAGKK